MHFILQYLGFVNLGNGGAFVPMETKRETVMDTCVVKQFCMNYFLVGARILRNALDCFRVQTL